MVAQRRQRQVKRARPHMPGYGIVGPREGRGLLPWAWARKRFESSHNYWLATITDGSRPHVMPVWGVWVGDAFFFSTGPSSRKARNLGREVRCVVTTEHASEAVIVEGRAALAKGRALLRVVLRRYKLKYGEEYPPDSKVFQVRPDVVFGFIEDATEFAGAATRWQFRYS